MDLLKQISNARMPLQKAIKGLREYELPTLAEHLERFFFMALPYLIKGSATNPVHHTAHVVNLMTEVLLDEKNKRGQNVAAPRIKRGVFAALLHDIGLAEAEGGRIRKADIQKKIEATGDWATVQKLVKEAVDSRRKHMEAGGRIAAELLHTYNAYQGQEVFTEEDVQAIRHLVEIHDNPSICEYVDLGRRWLQNHEGAAGEILDPGDYLFDSNDFLMMCLREADRLWMLTVEGIEVDLERDRKKAKKKPAEEGIPEEEVRIDKLARIMANIQRHREEMWLYQRFRPGMVDSYGFRKGLLYRTDKGYEIFQRQLAELERQYGVTIAVSLGGTKLAVAFVGLTGWVEVLTNPLRWRDEYEVDHTPKDGTNAEKLVEGIADEIRKAYQCGQDRRMKVGRIGVATKGPLQKTSDVLGPCVVVGECTTLPFGQYKFDRELHKKVAERVPELQEVPIEVLHDGAAAVLGEVSRAWSNGDPIDSMAAIIIGSGVGVGIWESGELFEGISATDPGDDLVRNLGSLGRHLIKVQPSASDGVRFNYEYRGAPFQQKYPPLDEDEGETYFSERIAGPWLAVILAEALLALSGSPGTIAAMGLTEPQLRSYLSLVKKEKQGLVISAQERSDLKDIEAKVLGGLTEAGRNQHAWAKNQIEEIGEEIGAALSRFILVFHRRGSQFVKRVTLVSTIAEKLGEGVPKGPGQFAANTNDLLIDRVRNQARGVFVAEGIDPATSYQLANGIARSTLDFQREFWAFAAV